ncbi:MAG TPA: hypothetical protein VH165_29885 [Kofleriaceae bacterium]|nr:hypothetical protein [Kofleriaceae bacterium]
MPAVQVPWTVVSQWALEIGPQQDVPSGTATALQVPSPLQAPTLHSSGGGQVYAMPLQTPPVQVSVELHVLPSLHVEPSSLAGLEQSPVVASQVPAS